LELSNRKIDASMVTTQTIENYRDRLTYNALRVIPNLALNYIPKLRTICIETNNICNLQCVFCNVHVQERKYGYMDLNLYRKIIGQSAKLKPTTLHLNFEGESFLHPHIKEFLELSVSSGAKYRQLFSNGMLVKPYLETIAKCLTKITFSLDGIGEVNDKLRVGCKYDVIMANIKELRQIRDNLGSSLKIGVNLTNYTQTEKEIHAFTKEMLGIADIVQISEYRDPLNHYTKPGYNRRIALKDTDDKRVARPVKYCAFPLNTLVVLWNGDISFCLCSVTSNPPMIAGYNAYKDKLKTIWESYWWKQMRNDSFRIGYPPYKVCVECEYRKVIR
jgi:MoaA/NifB/PqqE/SkfB family radical SAM enzyme